MRRWRCLNQNDNVTYFQIFLLYFASKEYSIISLSPDAAARCVYTGAGLPTGRLRPVSKVPPGVAEDLALPPEPPFPIAILMATWALLLLGNAPRGFELRWPVCMNAFPFCLICSRVRRLPNTSIPWRSRDLSLCSSCKIA